MKKSLKVSRIKCIKVAVAGIICRRKGHKIAEITYGHPDNEDVRAYCLRCDGAKIHSLTARRSQ